MEADEEQAFLHPNVLTSIHSRIHLAATQDTSEVDRLAIEHLIEVLAEVAMAVAARSGKVNEDKAGK